MFAKTMVSGLQGSAAESNDRIFEMDVGSDKTPELKGRLIH